jgi:hypothetical protein
MKELAVFFLAVFATASANADTLEMADGRLLEGDFVGSSNGIIMFNTGEDIEAYPEDQVVGIYLSSGVATAETLIASDQASNSVTIPAGTRLVIRMSETLDSKRHAAGHRFTAQMEGAIVVDGITVVPRGAVVYGRIAQSQQSGRAVGQSNLTTEFTDIMVDDQLVPIATGAMSAQTGGEGGRTVGRTARAAAIGGLIDGSSGARTGAKVGLGASILTSGASVNIPRGTIVETSLRAPVSVDL